MEKEFYAKTAGGYKPCRFGDIFIEDTETGEKWIIQVGRQTLSGNPVAREVKALRDLAKAGLKCFFVPYN